MTRTRTGGRPYWQWMELARRWHPRCPLCKELMRTDITTDGVCHNERCAGYGKSTGEIHLDRINKRGG